MMGCFELLLLLGMIAVLLVLMGRYPAFAKKLNQLLRSPRVSKWKLLTGAIVLGILTLVLLERVDKPGHPTAKLLFPLFFGAAILLFIWSMLRFLGLYPPDAAAIDRPPVRDKDLPSEPSLWAELGRLMAETSLLEGLGRLFSTIAARLSGLPNVAEPSLRGGLGRLIGAIAARVSRLSNKDLLLVAFLVVGLPFLFMLEDKHPPTDEWPVAVMVFLFWWAVCFAALCVIRWLLRKFTRSACPSIGHLKDLLAERLPAGERARLTTHLELCSVCQHRVEGLSMGRNSWPGLARKLSDRPAEPEPALRKVMDRLKEVEGEVTTDEPAIAADLPLGFLSPTDKPDQLGKLERYEVLQEIGRGGMGVVLKAFDPSLHRVVAIKVLAPQLATSGVARKRFMREAKAAAAVTHDHIVTIHAVDEANGLPYLVMQYIAGKSLQDRIDKDGPLELTDILRIGMQTASALAAAHAHGIVHRDIKPANILLEEGVQRVKITDFGLARAMDDASLTQSGFVAGSPLYMAPEQARGESLDHRADLFSLGSVLYTMCTGRPPFRAANTLAVLRRVSEDWPRPIRETNPEIPEWLADVVTKLMAKDPAERFPSAADVEEVLGRNLAQLQHASWVPPPRPPAPAPTPDLPTSVTICPSCGANLQVPERMVGEIVHCSECGKPFHVEEGSQVMQVARPARWPLRPDVEMKLCKIPRKRNMAMGCLVLPLMLVFIFLGMYLLRSFHQYQLPSPPATAKPPESVVTAEHWLADLNGLPSGASMFGAIDPNASEPWGSIKLDNAWIQSLARLLVSGEAVNQLAPENLGRIQLARLALGYYEGTKTEDSRLIVRLDGEALDGHKRIVDFIRKSRGEKVQVEELDKKMGANGPVCVSSPEWPFALKIRNDNEAFIAVSLKKDAKASQNRKLLDSLPAAGIGAGYNPPWIKNALSSNNHGIGFFLGEIPAEWRMYLKEVLKLRECPRSFVCHMARDPWWIGGTPPSPRSPDKGALFLYVTLNVEKAGADQTLRDDLEAWRPHAIKTLQAQFPLLQRDRQASALFGQILSSLHWKAHDGSVQAQAQISGSTWKALGEALARISKSYAGER